MSIPPMFVSPIACAISGVVFLPEAMQVTAAPSLRENLPKGSGVMDVNDLAYINANKGWFREGQHGREVTVDEIRVEPIEAERKYKMTAVIDGEVISHEITQEQYDKFMAIDDYHRMLENMSDKQSHFRTTSAGWRYNWLDVSFGITFIIGL